MASEEQRKPGKHLLLDVPTKEGSGGEEMSSYLLLGSPVSTSSQKPPSFTDDDRQRVGCPDFVPPGVRQAVTDLLFTKGGWIDYANGNRITTTRGDKLEVIQGSLKVMVLGRQAHKSGADASGGHVGESGITFEGESSISWVQDYDGTWKIAQTTIKGDVESTYVGDTIDRYHGELKKSTTGSENPCAPSDAVTAKDAKHKYNPTIIDRTWAESIESYTGSAALPVPRIASETWADEIASKTHAGKQTDSTVVNGTISSVTKAGEIIDETTATSIKSTTHADTQNLTYGDSTSEKHGDSKSFTYGNDFTLVQGISTEIMILGSNEVTLGEEISVTAGVVLDISLAAKLEIDLGAALTIGVGPKVELMTSETKIVASETDLSASKTEVNGVRSIVSGLIRMF